MSHFELKTDGELGILEFNTPDSTANILTAHMLHHAVTQAAANAKRVLIKYMPLVSHSDRGFHTAEDIQTAKQFAIPTRILTSAF